MKKYILSILLLSSFNVLAAAPAIILNGEAEANSPRKVCEVVVSNEKSTFYDCGNYVLSYTPQTEGNKSDNPQYYRYCQKKSDGSLAGCTYL